ncbi:Chromatin assembly factor 1 subunit A family protein [Brugia pahangi]|uniref:Chromatin assembly factor 1 subunit A n=1 Tax=Brugia pahangi TaxID=6280 RepID=A0A0N4TUF4_BRUPA|nr:unnamed protein product [Brugia pahangi]
MDINGYNKENEKVEVKNSAERCLDEVQQCSDEVIVGEIDDFVREVIEAVAYIIDCRKASSASRKNIDKIFETNDTDSVTGDFVKKEAQGNISVCCHRKIMVKQLTEKEKRMKERRRIAAEKMVAKNREATVKEKKRKKEEAQKEREKLKREQEEAKKKKRKEDLRRKEERKKEEEEKKERRRVEEEVRKQKKEKEDEGRKKKKKEEEERREKRKREEEAVQLKKKRESDRFLSYFDKKRKMDGEFERFDTMQTSSVLNVLPFFCKQGVSLAPLFRREPLSKEVHDSLLMEVHPVERLYLSTIKPRTVGKLKLNRAKLFQFHDNWRPPYYGTWRKRSTVITGRRPFAKDTEILDYEVDSDEEWEIPEGDDCDESTMSEDEEDSGHSSDSDGFIVQHGYLSEGEGEDEQDRLEYREDSNRRAERLRAVANEWKYNLEQKSKKFNKPLIPLLWGPHFELPAKGVPEEVEQAVFFEYSDENDVVEDDYDNSDGDARSNSYHDDIYIED